MPAKDAEPTIARRQLARLLKQWRERARMTHAELAGMASTSKMSRIESGRSAVSLETVWALCFRYGCSTEETAQATELCESANQPGWQEEFFDVVPDWLGIYAGLEGSASELQTYDPDVIHALLQTPEYAAAAIGMAAGLTPTDLNRRVEFRLQRQKRVLEGGNTTVVKCIIGESALTYTVGEPSLMKHQVEHLMELSNRVDIRVRPFSKGLHPWMKGPFAILNFPSGLGERPTVHTETHMGAQYYEKEKQVNEYLKIFTELHGDGVPIKEIA